jgi:hypothetical protein
MLGTSRMANEPTPIEVPSKDVQFTLIRARRIDPTCEESAIGGYMREIAEAEAMLDNVDLGAVPLTVSFSASWEDEPGQ